MTKNLIALEICAGAGGQAIGLERAGFEHAALIEIEEQFCSTLRLNRPNWNVMQADVKKFNALPYQGIDLLAGGVPCPPFSQAGKQLGSSDERDLFPSALRLVEETMPRAVMIENVRGLLDQKFDDYREQITNKLEDLGYGVGWKLLHSAHFGVPQLRPRTIMVALKEPYMDYFEWPSGNAEKLVSVGEALYQEMASLGWKGVDQWKNAASKVAPTLVGGSKKHGGADLGPTRAKKAWLSLGVDAKGLVEFPPHPDFDGHPRLTVQMAAIVQGFPREWKFTGKKTSAYRQVGNAFPPPVAAAVGDAIRKALMQEKKVTNNTLNPKFFSSTFPVS